MTQLIIAGLIAGSIYALLGIGLTLVFSTTRMLNVAHGDIALIAALSAISLHGGGVPLSVAYILAIVIAMGLGCLMYFFIVRPAHGRGASALTLLIASLALHLVLLNAAHLIWGSQGHALPPLFDGKFEFTAFRINLSEVTVLATLLLLLLVLRWMFVSTKFGLGLRAAAANPLSARLTGLRVERVTATAVILSAALAGIAGVLFAPTTLITYDMGLMLTLKGFVGATLARFTSYPITVVGCLALGLVEAFAAGFLSSGYRDAIAFIALIVILVVMAIPAHRRGVLAVSESH